jgi:DNA-binding PucR family transcriptional regulator
LDLGERVLRVLEHVEDLDDTPLEEGSAHDRIAFRRVNSLADESLVLRAEAAERDHAEDVTIAAQEVAEIRAGELDGLVYDGL